MEKASLRKGDNKKGAQKHQNRTSYRHNKNSKKTRKILALPISDNLCTRCKQILEWRKSFRKYKPLTTPKKCVACQLKAIKEAYHILCQPCAESKKVCAKCQQQYSQDAHEDEIELKGKVHIDLEEDFEEESECDDFSDVDSCTDDESI